MSADGTDTLGVVPLHAQRQPLAPPPAGIDAAIDPTLERVLAAILDAMVPSLPPATAAALADAHLARIAAADGPDPPPRDAVVLALGTGALAVGSPRNVARLVYAYVAPTQRFKLLIALRLLATAWGTAAITGVPTLTASFADLPLSVRQRAMRNLFLSPLPLLPMLNKSFAVLAGLYTYGGSARIDAFNDPTSAASAESFTSPENPFFAALQFPAYPVEKPLPTPGSERRPTFLDPATLPTDKDGVRYLDADVVVVGSGVGGGIAAAVLAQAGHRVVVLERARHVGRDDLSYQLVDSLTRLYDGGGGVQTDDGSMFILAGNAWGGGSFVNWSACLRLPRHTREEWAREYGLPYFASDLYDQDTEAVEKRMGVSAENINHSQQNQILYDGCQKAGYPCDTVPQNSGGVDHRCGFCSMGCPYGEKLGTHATWLHDAADAGAQFLEDAFVKRVLIDNKTRRVRGVEVLIGGADGGTPMPSKQNTKYRVVVKAHTVVAACGTLHTPGLLQRSGLKNRNIGRNVRLHPVTVAMGFFPDRLVRPYEGPILTRVSNVAASAGGEGKLTAEVAGLPQPPPRTLPPTGYGVRIETPASYPGFSGSLFPFRSPLDHRRLVLQYPRTATLIVIARDFDSTASLSYDPVTAHVAVDFALGAKDARALGEGVLAAGRILSAAGAAEVNSAQHHVPPLVLDGAPDDGKASGGVPANHFTDLSVWARASLAEGVRPVRTNLACAHQMGSCRMAATPARGAVDPHGRAFEARGLYVADASLFPTASGVNPMLTTATIAYRVACNIRDELAAGSGAAAAKGKKGARL